MSFFWAMRRAVHTSAEVSSAKNAAREARREAESVEDKLDRALIACEAMWSLLRDKVGVTDMELLDRITEIDLSDGELDGKVRKTPVTCPKCSRVIARRFKRCIYCGQPVIHDPFS